MRRQCKHDGCPHEAETNLNYCRGHEGGFDAPFVGRTEADKQKKELETYTFFLLPGQTFRPLGHGYTITNGLLVPLDVTIRNANTVPEIDLREAKKP